MKKKFKATVPLQVRFPLDIRQKLEVAKEETGKSLNTLIVEAIKGYLKDDEPTKPVSQVKPGGLNQGDGDGSYIS